MRWNKRNAKTFFRALKSMARIYSLIEINWEIRSVFYLLKRLLNASSLKYLSFNQWNNWTEMSAIPEICYCIPNTGMVSGHIYHHFIYPEFNNLMSHDVNNVHNFLRSKSEQWSWDSAHLDWDIRFNDSFNKVQSSGIMSPWNMSSTISSAATWCATTMWHSIWHSFSLSVYCILLSAASIVRSVNSVLTSAIVFVHKMWIRFRKQILKSMS